MEKLKPKNHKFVINRDVQLFGVTSKIGHPYFSLILFAPLQSPFRFSILRGNLLIEQLLYLIEIAHLL